MKTYHDINWRSANEKLKELQEEMLVAYRAGNKERVNDIQHKIIRSFAGRALAVRKVTTNKGGKTPGIDGILWDTPAARISAIEKLGVTAEALGSYKADPVKRVWIPKGNGDKRPIGIPTMLDRAVQALVASAMDPLVEETSDPNSYGFRKYKSADDAICRIRTLLDKPHSTKWVLDADIEKCFDRIAHEAILERVPFYDKHPVREWLKAGVLEGREKQTTEMGTPQGGVISPILCNLVLNGLEKMVKEVGISARGTKSKSVVRHLQVVRYADDFIITSPTKELLEKTIVPAVEEFLKTRGLNISAKKTRIVNLEEEELIFLGWELKRQTRKWYQNESGDVAETTPKNKESRVLVIRPARKSEDKVRENIREAMRKHQGGPIEGLIKEVNPIVRGWTNYFRSSYHSQATFARLGHYIYESMQRWCRKKHPTRSAEWIYDKYVKPAQSKTRTWSWGVSPEFKIIDPTEVVTAMTRPLKEGLNPYSKEGDEYYRTRITIRNADKFRKQVYKIYEWLCPLCNESLSGEEPVELHHIIPKEKGGEYKLNNIMPLHRVCHQQVTHNPSIDVGKIAKKIQVKKKKPDSDK